MLCSKLAQGILQERHAAKEAIAWRKKMLDILLECL